MVNQDTNYGDRDGDGVVNSTDKGTPGTTCTGTVTGECRILDLDFDGDYDSADATLFDSLDQGLARHPGRPATNVDHPFGHQGLLYDAELTSYQNRARQYMPTARRFAQRDPLAQRPFARSGYYDGMNLYGYVSGNPYSYKDSLGLATEVTCTTWTNPSASWTAVKAVKGAGGKTCEFRWCKTYSKTCTCQDKNCIFNNTSDCTKCCDSTVVTPCGSTPPGMRALAHCQASCPPVGQPDGTCTPAGSGGCKSPCS